MKPDQSNSNHNEHASAPDNKHGQMDSIYPPAPDPHTQDLTYPEAQQANNSNTDSHYNEPPTNDHSGLRSVISTVILLAIAPLIAFGITSYAIQSYQVDGQSMETTLQNGDRLIVDKAPRTVSRLTGHAYVPHRGNIIIFNQANLPDTSLGQSKQLIKRVIGLPGEHVVVRDGKITIYNSEHPEGFNPDTTTGYTITAPSTPGEADVILQKDQIFVCGDNRPNSEDSRYFGPIKVDQIVGKLSLRLLPANKAQRF
jgi:signal peptidase I